MPLFLIPGLTYVQLLKETMALVINEKVSLQYFHIFLGGRLMNPSMLVWSKHGLTNTCPAV